MDLQNYEIDAQADANVNVARIRVRCTVWVNGVQVADFTGGNAIVFAIRIQGFSVAQHREVVELVANKVIRMKAGIE